MSEEAATQAEGAATATTTETTTETPQESPGMHPLFADAESNTLAPDFANKLGPDLEPYANVLNDRFGGQPITALAKSYGEANKTISEGGRAIAYPAADAPEADWEKWSKANGVPEKAEDYQLFDEGQQPGNLNDEAVGMFKQMFAEAKVPPALAAKLAQEYVKIDGEMARRLQDQHENKLAEYQKELQRELGPEYETRMKQTKAVVDQMGYDIQDGELFDNPKVVGFLTKVVGLLGEDTVASMTEAAAKSGAFSDPYTEANKIMTDPNHPDFERYQRGDQEIAAKVNRLLSQRRS